MEYAGKSLGSRMRSERDLRRLMLERASPDEDGRQAVDAVLARLKELGYLNDEAYARTVAEHYAAKGWGPARIREELYRRGVPRDYWDGALEELAAPDDAIDAFLRKKLRGADLTDPKTWKRAADALARRGFRWEDISAGLRRLGAEPEE